MTISNELLSTTMYEVRDSETDLLYKTCPILDLVKKAGGQETDDYGTHVREPLAVTTHGQLTAFPSGAERMDMGVRDVTVYADFPAADLGGPIFISRKEESENRGDKQIIKLAEVRVRAMMNGSRREINRQLIAGDSIVAQRAGLNSLYGHATGITTGFLEGRTPGTQGNTVGGQVKTIATGWRNQFATVAGSFSANGKDAMDQIHTNIRTKGQFGAANVIIASSNAFRFYKKTLFSHEEYGSKDALDGGRMSLAYDNAIMEPDDDMPSTHGTAAFNPGFYFLNTKAMAINFWTDGEFDLSEFRDLTSDQIGRQAVLYIKMQLTAKHLGSLGFVGDANTY